jgi:hypothetical protein
MSNLTSLGLFPSGNQGYEKGYSQLRKKYGSSLVLPGEIVDFLGTCCSLVYTDEQYVALSRQADLLRKALDKRPPDEKVVILAGVPFLVEPIKIYEYFQDYFDAGSETWADCYKKKKETLLCRRLNDRVGFPWMILRVPEETYGKKLEDQLALMRSGEQVPNFGELLWAFGAYHHCRGNDLVGIGRALRATSIISSGNPLLRTPRQDGYVIVARSGNGIRIADGNDVSEADSEIGLPFVERIIKKL